MFNETVLTVGYPIVIDGTPMGGIFMCKPMDILKSSTLGMTIIKGLTNQIEGKISVIESIHGLTYKLVF